MNQDTRHASSLKSHVYFGISKELLGAIVFYLLITLLLLRIVWRMWRWKDLTNGDTSAYCIGAFQWAHRGWFDAITMVYSPLYVVFYSFFIATFKSAYAATIAHRLVILLILAWSIAGLCRVVLPRAIAWFIAAWWIILPINWNALYEVHLFGLIFFVLGSWVAGLKDLRVNRGLGLAAFLAGSLFVRNEFILATTLFGILIFISEIYEWRKRSSRGITWFPTISQVLGPSILVIIGGFALFHQSLSVSLSKAFKSRHLVNVGQVFAYGYQQRNSTWAKSPWVDYDGLMKEQFGKSEVTFSEAAQRNPWAMWEYVAWNFKLLPSGLQLALFNAYSGKHTPDFIPQERNLLYARSLSCVVLGLAIAGLACLWRQRSFWSTYFNQRRRWCMAAMMTTLIPCLLAIVTQRPRPSYIFMTTLLLMIFFGLCLNAILRELRLYRGFNRVSPLFAFLVIALAHPPRGLTHETRDLYEIYQRLYPYRQLFSDRANIFAAERFPMETCNYLGEGTRIELVSLNDSRESQTAAEFSRFLAEHKVSLLYLDRDMLRRPDVADWLSNREGNEWRVVARSDKEKSDWMLLCKSK